MKLAIMQPTYLPWIGYFGMIYSVDTFVFLDSVQFNKRSWQQRNKIKTPNGELFLTIPVSAKGKSDQLIKDVEINTEHFAADKMLLTITQNYKKAKYFNEYFPAIKEVFMKGHTHLSDFNIDLITYCSQVFCIKTPLLLSSKLKSDGSKADLLSNICVELGSKLYLSAPGSKEYIDESTAFQEKNIEVIYHQYSHPSYTQLHGDFMPYMCILDLLFNEGPNSLDIILSGYKS